MGELTLTKDEKREILKKLEEAGYEDQGKQKHYLTYSRERGDSVFIYHSRKVITAKKDTRGQKIILDRFGCPNGKPPKGKGKAYDSWFFNGYKGKGHTRIE